MPTIPSQIRSKIVTISAYAPTDFFAKSFDVEYDDFLCKNGTVPQLINVDSLYFENTPFSETFTYKTLESDLQRCVDYIKAADIITIFSSIQNEKEHDPKYEFFLDRLFHPKYGNINSDIWGDTNFGNKKLRLIHVFSSLENTHKVESKEMHLKLQLKIPGAMDDRYKILGFNEVYRNTLRILQNNIHSKHAQEYLKRMRALAEKDLFTGYEPRSKKQDANNSI